ncbi:hypothetical protein ACHWQZ_G007813 [Mnemiopsis leidyi]
MSKFSRNKHPRGSSSSDKSSPIELIEMEKGNLNKWQLAYSAHMKQNKDGNISSQNSAIITPMIANITNTVVKYKLQGELRGMLFNSKKINSGLGYSIAILIANIIFILFGTFVFVYIEGKAETKERLGDYEAKVHLMNHINNSKNILPQNKTRHEYIAELYEKLLSLQMEMCEKGNSKAGEKMWQYTGSLHYCLTILSTIGYGVTAPHNNLSKALSVIYALLGIPVYAVYLSYAYLAISTALNALSQLLFTCIRRNPGEVVRLLTKLFLANFILWSYLLLLVFLWTPIQDLSGMYRVLPLLLVILLGVAVQGREECESQADIRCRLVCSNRGDRCLCGTDGQTYRNTCEMRCNAQFFKMKIFNDHPGPCMEECTAEDFDGFKYRFVEWFDMIEKDETSLDYIRVPELDRQGVLMVMFRSLDTTDDMVLEWGELVKVAENPYEHCVSEFYRLCDTDKDQQLSVNEWGDCFETHIRMMPCDRLRAKAAKARERDTRIMAKRLLGIVVLGCPSVIKGTASAMFEQRVAASFQLYQANKQRNPLVVCTGYHIPGSSEAQAEALKNSLINKGVPEENIIVEEQSRSTLENAVMAKPILDAYGVKDVAVVTNKFHVDRSRYIFESMCQGYNLTFEEAPDGVTDEQLRELSKLESRKMVNLRPKMIQMMAST